MPQVTWTHTFLDVFLHHVPKNVRSVVDVGCGRGIVGSLLRIYREPDRIVGIDLFEPYLDFCRKLGVYDGLTRHDLETASLPFKDKEFDLSVALEVIEHLPKQSGRTLMGELERISEMVIVSTPNRYFHQDPYDGNSLQKHLSRWTVQDLKTKGYKVLGVGGLLFFGKEVKYLSYALGRLTLVLPRLSSTIMGVYYDKPKANFRGQFPRSDSF